jgi:hypothetical protein
MSSLAASVTVLVWLVKTAPRALSRSPRRTRFGVPAKFNALVMERRPQVLFGALSMEAR